VGVRNTRTKDKRGQKTVEQANPEVRLDACLGKRSYQTKKEARDAGHDMFERIHQTLRRLRVPLVLGLALDHAWQQWDEQSQAPGEATPPLALTLLFLAVGSASMPDDLSPDLLRRPAPVT
jgi:hypothetical protein